MVDPAATARIRVAAVPSSHPYVRAVADPGVVTLLPDPPHAGRPDTQWWPPQMLDAGWIREHGASFDVLHLHFGMESYAVDHVADALTEARRLGKPVVYTAHDLQNPQLHDQAEHERMLAAVLAESDVTLTLTPGTAAEIARRWPCRPIVIPHPTLLDAAPAPVAPASAPRIGVHLRDLRANIDAVGAVRALARAVARDPWTASVLMNDRVRDDALAQAVEAEARAAGTEVVRTPRLSDAGVLEWIAGLDAFVLPYRHGTHSGWVEMCWDAGVPVIGPPGHFAGQHPRGYTTVDVTDAARLAQAITAATAAACRPGSTARARLVASRRTRRRAQLGRVRRRHAEVYRAALTERAAA